jgi:hypothetical protein
MSHVSFLCLAISTISFKFSLKKNIHLIYYADSMVLKKMMAANMHAKFLPTKLERNNVNIREHHVYLRGEWQDALHIQDLVLWVMRIYWSLCHYYAKTESPWVAAHLSLNIRFQQSEAAHVNDLSSNSPEITHSRAYPKKKGFINMVHASTL